MYGNPKVTVDVAMTDGSRLLLVNRARDPFKDAWAFQHYSSKMLGLSASRIIGKWMVMGSESTDSVKPMVSFSRVL